MSGHLTRAALCASAGTLAAKLLVTCILDGGGLMSAQCCRNQ